MIRHLKLKIALLLFFICLTISCVSVGLYIGNPFIYLSFSALYFVLLLSGFLGKVIYGYLFLVVMLWLGFWGKITSHLLVDYPYKEPTGLFDNTPESWDSVLLISSVAACGVMMARIFTAKIIPTTSETNKQPLVPDFYIRYRSVLWVFLLIFIVCVQLVNFFYGVNQIGLVPRTIFPWPMNAIISWQLSIGSALCLTVFIWWDILLKKNIAIQVLSIPLEACTSTLSLLSRGIYVFHTVPQLFALYKLRQRIVGISSLKVFILLFCCALLLFISIAGVTALRNSLYSAFGGLTSENQIKLTRLEVLDGGIKHVKSLIAKGENQEEHLAELIAEREQIKSSLNKNVESAHNNIKKINMVKSAILWRINQLSEKVEESNTAVIVENNSTINNALDEKATLENVLDQFVDMSKLDSDTTTFSVLRAVIQMRIEAVNGLIILDNQASGRRVQTENLESEIELLTGILTEYFTLPESTSKVEVEVPPVGPRQHHDTSVANILSLIEFERVVPTILSLSVDRWIGVEGVMAVYSYEGKSTSFFLNALTEKREIGKVTAFQEVTNSHYRWSDSSKWQFASLPGPAAFFYLSGSYLFVFVGLLVLTLLLLFSECLIFYLVKNPIMCSLFGITAANTVSQFGITPLQDLPFYAMIFVFVIFVALLQSRFLNKGLSPTDKSAPDEI